MNVNDPGNVWAGLLNPLNPNIHIQILQTGLYTSPSRISWENLVEDQNIFPLVIISLILPTLSLDCILILFRENWCLLLLGLKGLMSFTNRYIVSVPFMLTYYSQITRQRAVLKFKFHLLKLWFHALIVLYKGFTDFTLVLFWFQKDCHLRYSRAEAGATGTLTTAFRDWFLRR